MTNERLQEIKTLLQQSQSRDEKLSAICALLAEQTPHYDWVGFYLVDEHRENTLILGPFVGEATEHVEIAFGQGICGQAAAQEHTFVIQDVTTQTNYLSCSPDVKSEIVVPIYQQGKIVGELDIDSHQLAPFTEQDQIFLEQVCDLVATLF